MKKIKNKAVIIFSFLLILSFNSCLLNKKNPNLEIIINHDKEDFYKSSILIFNFMAPDYNLESGKIASATAKNILLKEKIFKVISEDYFDWDLAGKSEEEKIVKAMIKAKKAGYDYLMIGNVKDFIYGGLNKTKVRVKIRIIELKSRITVFMAENSLAQDYKEGEHPFNPKLSKESMKPQKLIYYVMKGIFSKL